jgi:protein TonB
VSLVRQPFWPSLAVAATLHALAFAWVATRPPPRLQARRPPTTVRLVAREKAPAPPPEPKPEAPKPPAPRALPPPSTSPTIAAAVPPAAAPAATPPPRAAAPQPRRFAVAMSATSPGGGVAVPVTSGPTAARGNPLLPPTAPVGDNTAFARAATEVTEVERAPQLLRQPSSLELRALYPEEARRAGLEGDVRLELVVDERGAVSEVRLLEGAGHGFDEVAARAARLIVFRPAERGGRPVAVRLPWTLKFRLDG